MAELTLLGSLDSEKWLDILGFVDFRPVLFVTKYYTVNSSQISPSLPFVLLTIFFQSSPKMTIGEDQIKDRFKN